EQRVGLGHRGFRRVAGQPDLEEVVHDPQAVEPRLVGGPRDPGHLCGELGDGHRPGEVAERYPDLHRERPPRIVSRVTKSNDSRLMNLPSGARLTMLATQCSP